MGDEGSRIARSWGDQVGSFELILKSLVLDLNRLNSRVDGLESHHGSQLDTTKRQLGNLVANVQGFVSQEQVLADQRQNRETLRQSLSRSTSVSEGPRGGQHQGQCQGQDLGTLDLKLRPSIPAADNLDRSCDARPALVKPRSSTDCGPSRMESRQTDLKRSRARQRWRWALMKIRMRQIRGRIPMTFAYVGRSNSIAIRLQEVEALLDSVDYNVRHLTAHAGPDKVNKTVRMANWLDEALHGGAGQDTVNKKGILSRLLGLEHKVDAVCEIASAADTRSKGIEISCENFRHGLREAAEQAVSAVEDISFLRNKIDRVETLSRDELPRARRQAVAFISALRNTCFAAMRSRHVAALPGGKSLIQDCLLPIHRELEMAKDLQVPLENAGDRKQWRIAALQAARYLFSILRKDRLSQDQKVAAALEDKPSRISSLDDVPIDLVGEQAYRVEKDYDAEFVVDVVGNIANAQELALTRAKDEIPSTRALTYPLTYPRAG
tara:strand:+ start:1849 stop:3333 length:1485 start_codon:yes stop_codon:yes gene_type:complete